MSIRFKFRSSVTFDSVDIEGQPSVSVRDLKSKIVRQKNLHICQDFDLVFSDALTGHEYNDENFRIPSGSSVIIKRVPSGSLPSATGAQLNSVENFGIEDSNLVNPVGYLPANAKMDNFDDFGVDLCPAPEAALYDSDIEIDRNCIVYEKGTNAAPRLMFQKHETSDLSEAIPIGTNMLQTKLEQKVEEDVNSRKNQVVMNANCPAAHDADLPSELKCSLCSTFFKEAVMIPCCQHSFCEKCIHAVLIEKAKCPKCSSSKCRVGDLLPNLSLRQAIERFLESQILLGGPDNALHKYAPDGESGIHANDVSCAVTIFQRDPDMPNFLSATEKRSNQIMAESVYESLTRNNASFGVSGSCTNKLGSSNALNSALPSQNGKQRQRVGYAPAAHHTIFQSDPEDAAAITDFQGENQPNLPLTRVHEEAYSSINTKSELWVNNGGGGRNFMVNGRHRKGDRTCYMCGSPDHFIRDCPVASYPHPVPHTGHAMFPGAMTGYASPYWNGTPPCSMRSFTNMYGNPGNGMMPFSATMVPITPFAVPPYMPSIYGGFPAPSGFMRMGGLAPPVGITADCQTQFLEFQECKNRRKLSNENMERRQYCDHPDYDFHDCCDRGRSHEYNSPVKREKSESYSEDSFTQRSQRKYKHDKYLGHGTRYIDERHDKNSRPSIAGRDRRLYHSERSSSVVEDMPNSSDKHREERQKHRQKNSKKHERRDQCTSDSSWGKLETTKQKYFKRRFEDDVKGHNWKHQNHSESSLEPSSSCEQKRRHREKDSSYGSRYSRHSSKSISDELCNDRWQMVHGSDEDCRDGYRHSKRRRVY